MNAGDGRRSLALTSDGLPARIGPLDADALDGLATPAAARPRERGFTLEEVRDGQVPADGRVAAAVVEGNRKDPHPAPGRSYRLRTFQTCSQGQRRAQASGTWG